MIDLLKPLLNFLKTKEVDSTNLVWRLHSRVTVYLLVFFTLLLSARTYFGEPIDCISTAPESVKKSLNTFCWILGTFISNDPKFVHASWDFIEIGDRMGSIPKEERVYIKYYQWVSVLLAIQAFLFSLPKHLWRIYEKSRMQDLCEGLTTILVPPGWNPVRKGLTLQYLTQEPNRKHCNYALIFFGCELLNFLIVLFNMWMMRFIFGGFWNSYQPAVQALFSLDMNSWMSLNSLVFPKLATCEFITVGPSGTKQNFDALCLLPQNVVNEKIFAFLWLWFICLAIISGVQVCYRLIQICCQSVRLQLIYCQLAPFSYHRVKRVVREANIGHWFLLYQMARNINRNVMKEIITDLAKIGQERTQSIQNLGQQQIVEDEEEIEDDEVTV
ncbi:innexin inx4 [Topomyia yanbarensis]|uniref:innexin inx4 n=1 Tax=Topomyia yanbarensis TaxID=2498891 RepID=UPI00273B7087|nr:innexin inx4 [Topomyia yanbarensis]